MSLEMRELPTYLTAEQVAEKLQVSKKRVLDLPIPQVRVGPRTIRYLPEDVAAYMEKRRVA